MPQVPDPVVSTAYRKRKKTAEERHAERSVLLQQEAAVSKGTVHWYDSSDQLPTSKPQRKAPLMFIDGYNYLNADPQLKQYMNGSQYDTDRARAILDKHLKTYAVAKGYQIEVVYDAMGSSGSEYASYREISNLVTAVYTAGCEADTYIIDCLDDVKQDVKQAHSQRTVMVVSDDRRIQESCGVYDLDTLLQYNVMAFANSFLIQELQQHSKQTKRGSFETASSSTAVPDVNSDTVAWARGLLEDLRVSYRGKHHHKDLRGNAQEERPLAEWGHFPPRASTESVGSRRGRGNVRNQAGSRGVDNLGEPGIWASQSQDGVAIDELLAKSSRDMDDLDDLLSIDVSRQFRLDEL